MDRKILTASDGKVLTDGKNYGKIIYLADGADESVWREISEVQAEEEQMEVTAEEALEIIMGGTHETQ